MNSNVSTAARDIRKLALLGAVAAAAIGLACSTQKPSTTNAGDHSASAPAAVHAAALKTVAAVSPQPEASATTASPAKDPSKLAAYRSRDYAVSFQYPWQYAYLSARTIANGDDSLRPTPDGHDGQIALARIEIPQGYYPDTDFDSAYFILGLNQNISEEQCTLTPDKGAALHTDTINGVPFQWVEVASGGRGSASRIRNYVSFVNGACYEIEMGLKTSNADGLAREVNSAQVFSRLESILRTVNIRPALKDAPAQMQSAAVATPAPQQ